MLSTKSLVKDFPLISNPKIKVATKYRFDGIMTIKLKFKLKGQKHQIEIIKSSPQFYYCDYLIDDEVIVYYWSHGISKTYMSCFYSAQGMINLKHAKILHNVKNELVCIKKQNEVHMYKVEKAKDLRLARYEMASDISFYESDNYYYRENETTYLSTFSLYFLSTLPPDLELSISELFDTNKIPKIEKTGKIVKVHFSDKIAFCDSSTLQKFGSDFINDQLDNPEQDVYILNFKREDLKKTSISTLYLLKFLGSNTLAFSKKNLILQSIKY